jgi:hypothetical protein
MGIMDYINAGTKAVGDYAAPVLDYANDYKDAIGAIGGLAGMYFDYQANQDMAGLAQQQLNAATAEQARQVGKEVANTDAIQQGFQTGYIDPRKKRDAALTTPYTGLAGYGSTQPIGNQG